MKKILSMLLSLALVSASFVTAMAEAKPYAKVTVNPLDTATYEGIMMESITPGSSAYEVIIDLNNLPDLTWARGSKGTKVGTFALKLFTDITKITRTQSMNTIEKSEDWGAETYGVLKVTNDAITLNAIDNSITIGKNVTAAADGFPYTNEEQTLDVEGVLANAIVMYIEATEEPVITSVSSQITTYADTLDAKTLTKVTEFLAGAEGCVNSDGSYNTGFETSKTADSSFSATKVVFDFLGEEGETSYEIALPTEIQSGSNVIVALNITNVPAGVSFQCTDATFE